jgi:hypothetical protein
LFSFTVNCFKVDFPMFAQQIFFLSTVLFYLLLI